MISLKSDVTTAIAPSKARATVLMRRLRTLLR